MSPRPIPPPLHLRLRDGLPVLARELVAADREGLEEAYRRLSPEARYHRFWTREGRTLGAGMLDRLLHHDPGNHAVWALLDPARAFPGLGAASWWRDPADPLQAEVSATVLDGDHGRGAGTLLLALMWVSAWRAGIERFIAYALVENRAAARWMRDCGGRGEWDGSQLIFRWNLADPSAIPATPAGRDLAARLVEVSELLPPPGRSLP